jgi:MtN3 and saliva related transmembrane protein
MLMQELIGWGSALVLLPTFGVQTYRQWKGRHEHAGSISLWFFILAFIGTLGQFIYSWMVNNWVYLALNGCLVVNNAIGLGIAIYRTRLPAHEPASAM